MKIKDQNGSLVDTMNKKTRLNVTYWDMLRFNTPRNTTSSQKERSILWQKSH